MDTNYSQLLQVLALKLQEFIKSFFKLATKRNANDPTPKFFLSAFNLI